LASKKIWKNKENKKSEKSILSASASNRISNLVIEDVEVYADKSSQFF